MALHELATAAVQAAAARAAERGVRIGIVVLDARFAVSASLGMDGAYPSVFNVARAKAKTALNFGAATADLAARIKPENQAALVGAEPGLMFVAGGVPIRSAGRLIGSIGVSGGSADQDAECAQQALEAVDWSGVES